MIYIRLFGMRHVCHFFTVLSKFKTENFTLILLESQLSKDEIKNIC